MLSMLTVLFVGLKLCEVIAWSWWLVFLPTIVEVSIVFTLAILAAIVSKNK